MSAAITIPIKRMNRSQAFKQAKDYFPDGVGGVFPLPQEKWLIATNFPLSRTFLMWWKSLLTTNCAYVEAYGPQVLWVVVRDSKLQVVYLGSYEHAEVLMTNGCSVKQPALETFKQIKDSHPLMHKVNALTAQGALKNPEHNDLGRVAINYKRLSRHQKSMPLSALAVMTAICTMGYMFLPDKSVPVVEPPSDTDKIAEILERLPGKVTPLLRLDYNNQTALSQIHGWRLKSSSMTTSSLRYEIVRDGGNLRYLRKKLSALNMKVEQKNGQWLASQPVALPAPIAEIEKLDWVDIEALSDWIDYQLELWLPGAKLLSVPEKQHGDYRIHRFVLLFEKQYLPDLLTLAAILEKLPVQFQSGEVERHKNQISGHIELIGVGKDEQL